jgi:acyl-CoA thioesterase FadM
LEDKIILETEVTKVSPLTVTFTQTIKDKLTNRVYVSAEVEVVAINNSGKLYRRLPEVLKEACLKAMDE